MRMLPANIARKLNLKNLFSTMRRHKMDHLVINLITAVAGKARCTLPSPATAVVEFMAKWSNLYPRKVLKVPAHDQHLLQLCHQNVDQVGIVVPG